MEFPECLVGSGQAKRRTGAGPFFSVTWPRVSFSMGKNDKKVMRSMFSTSTVATFPQWKQCMDSVSLGMFPRSV